MAEIRRVCVTGAGGYVASWLVKLLLSKGFIVHGTVRDPGEKMPSNERLFKADLLDIGSLSAAISGCEGVFHVACPVPSKDLQDPEVEMVRPAVEGTLNVLKACSEAVRRVVLVSSCSAVYVNPSWPFDKLMDDNSWSDKELCREKQFWYEFAKTVSEEKAVEHCKSFGPDLVVLCPSLVIGPRLQSTINATSQQFIEFFKGNRISIFGSHILFLVDVRDVSEALLLVYEKPEARGRYICNSINIETRKFCDKLKKLYPNFPYPIITNEELPYHIFSSEKLLQLGWKQRPLKDSIQESVEDLLNKSILSTN
ncbi:cinnamoyl-CoA reductase 1-like [Wolffia australiana]